MDVAVQTDNRQKPKKKEDYWETAVTDVRVSPKWQERLARVWALTPLVVAKRFGESAAECTFVTQWVANSEGELFLNIFIAQRDTPVIRSKIPSGEWCEDE